VAKFLAVSFSFSPYLTLSLNSIQFTIFFQFKSESLQQRSPDKPSRDCEKDDSERYLSHGISYKGNVRPNGGYQCILRARLYVVHACFETGRICLKVAHPFPHPNINTTAVVNNTSMVRNFLRKEKPAKLW
jgi:hypothetical protein